MSEFSKGVDSPYDGFDVLEDLEESRELSLDRSQINGSDPCLVPARATENSLVFRRPGSTLWEDFPGEQIGQSKDVLPAQEVDLATQSECRESATGTAYDQLDETKEDISGDGDDNLDVLANTDSKPETQFEEVTGEQVQDDQAESIDSEQIPEEPDEGAVLDVEVERQDNQEEFSTGQPRTAQDVDTEVLDAVLESEDGNSRQDNTGDVVPEPDSTETMDEGGVNGFVVPEREAAFDIASALSRREQAEQRSTNGEGYMPWDDGYSDSSGVKLIKVREGLDGPLVEVEVDAKQDMILREVFGADDYDYLLRSGLFARFAVDATPENEGESPRHGILHVLGGETRKVGRDEILVGAHHAPTAERILAIKSVLDGNGAAPPSLYMVTDGKEQIHPADVYRVHRMEYDGIPKMTQIMRNGRADVVPATSTMFPVCFTPRDVIDCISMARQNVDPPSIRQDRQGNWISEGFAPAVDGKGVIKVTIVEDRDTHRIKAAWPVPEGSSPMLLSWRDIRDMARSSANPGIYSVHRGGR